MITKLRGHAICLFSLSIQARARVFLLFPSAVIVCSWISSSNDCDLKAQLKSAEKNGCFTASLRKSLATFCLFTFPALSLSGLKRVNNFKVIGGEKVQHNSFFNTFTELTLCLLKTKKMWKIPPIINLFFFRFFAGLTVDRNTFKHAAACVQAFNFRGGSP